MTQLTSLRGTLTTLKPIRLAVLGRAVKNGLNLGRYGKRSLDCLLQAGAIERTSIVGVSPLPTPS